MGQLRILDRRCFGTSRISVDSIIFEAATYPAKRSATEITHKLVMIKQCVKST